MQVKEAILRIKTLTNLCNTLKENISKSLQNDECKVEIDIDDADKFAEILQEEIIKLQEMEVK